MLLSKSKLVFIQKTSVMYGNYMVRFWWNLVYILYIWKKDRCSQFGYNILPKNKAWPIVFLAAMRYIGQIVLVPTYIELAAIISMCAKFHHDSFETKRLVCIASDGHMDRRTGLVRTVFVEADALWGWLCLLKRIAIFWLKWIYPMQNYNNKLESFRNKDTEKNTDNAYKIV